MATPERPPAGDRQRPPRAHQGAPRPGSGPPSATRIAASIRRLRTTWSSLSGEQRLVAVAALGLFLTMFLPWYSTSFPLPVGKTGIRLAAAVDSKKAIEAFTFVEAAVLLVAISVLLLLKARADGKAFHLPGGDGTVITAAGGWTCVLIIWRLFDKPHLGAAVVGLKWGIFAALAVAGMLTYAGLRLRATHQLEPPLLDDEPVRSSEPATNVHIPEDRPHLAQTTVLRDDRSDTSETVWDEPPTPAPREPRRGDVPPP